MNRNWKKTTVAMRSVYDIDRMLARGKVMLRKAGIPISHSICPAVRLFKSHRTYGRCCGPQSRQNKAYPKYDYEIHISMFTLGNTEKSVMNTILHELIHTCPDCHGHDAKWKHYAAIVNEKYGYNIQRCDGDKTETDRANLRAGLEERHGYRLIKRYAVGCPDCDNVWWRSTYCKLVRAPFYYRCPRCGSKLYRRYELEPIH